MACRRVHRFGFGEQDDPVSLTVAANEHEIFELPDLVDPNQRGAPPSFDRFARALLAFFIAGGSDTAKIGMISGVQPVTGRALATGFKRRRWRLAEQ